MSDESLNDKFPNIVEPANEESCDDCGDVGEYIVQDETQIEVHALCEGCYDERSADHPDEIRILTAAQSEVRHCLDCGNRWVYSGLADRPTCSNPDCRGKRTEVVDD